MELLNALSRKANNIPFKIILYSQNTRGISAKHKFPFSYLHLYIPNRPFFKILSDIFRIKKVLTNYNLIHIPHNTDYTEQLSKTIFTIHDLIVYRYPEMWGVENNKKFFLDLNEKLKKCKAIITCSESSKNDIINFIGINKDKVYTIPWGINRDIFYPTYNDGFVKNIGIVGHFYFSASCNHQRKNLPLLLKAFKKYLLNGGKGQLVLLNPIINDLESYKALIESRKIIICTNISDKNLAELYSLARCSIIISEYEGFGFPIIESLACHTMVLSAKNSSLLEAGGNVIDYFDKLDEDTICQKLLYYDGIAKINSIDIEKVEEHLKLFSWDKCASEYINVYNKLLSIE